MNDTTDKNGNIIVGLDIGTTKVVALVGEISDKGELNVVGMGSHLSLGIKKGVVVDIESTVLRSRRHRVRCESRRVRTPPDRCR